LFSKNSTKKRKSNQNVNHSGHLAEMILTVVRFHNSQLHK